MAVMTAVDYRLTEVGRQNWEVCTRMLAHDLVDIAKTNKEIEKLLRFYNITILPNGAHTMALPRLMVCQLEPEVKKIKLKGKKKTK